MENRVIYLLPTYILCYIILYKFHLHDLLFQTLSASYIFLLTSYEICPPLQRISISYLVNQHPLKLLILEEGICSLGVLQYFF